LFHVLLLTFEFNVVVCASFGVGERLARFDQQSESLDVRLIRAIWMTTLGQVTEDTLNRFTSGVGIDFEQFVVIDEVFRFAHEEIAIRCVGLNRLVRIGGPTKVAYAPSSHVDFGAVYLDGSVGWDDSTAWSKHSAVDQRWVNRTAAAVK
jgi:hypothetical protein